MYNYLKKILFILLILGIPYMNSASKAMIDTLKEEAANLRQSIIPTCKVYGGYNLHWLNGVPEKWAETSGGYASTSCPSCLLANQSKARLIEVEKQMNTLVQGESSINSLRLKKEQAKLEEVELRKQLLRAQLSAIEKGTK
jgi:hypothetical protein